MTARQTSDAQELDQSAQYWLDIAENHLICDAWAIDNVDLPNWEGQKLVLVSAAGTPFQIQEAARVLRNQRTNAHITSSERARWRSSLDTTPLSQSLMFRTPLPDTGIHHMTLAPSGTWFQKHHHLTLMQEDLPIYLFPKCREELHSSLGNALRRMTELLCPPQWDQALLRICQKMEIIQPLETHGIVAWRLKPDVERIQSNIQRQVSAGHLSL